MADYLLDEAWDFHLKAGSPALTGAYSGNDLTPYFAGSLTVKGQSFTSPAVQPQFGAYGTK